MRRLEKQKNYMIQLGRLYSFKDYYFKKISNLINEEFFFEHHEAPLNSLDEILNFVNQMHYQRRGIVFAYLKGKNDLSYLVKLLKALQITGKKKVVKVLVINNYFGFKHSHRLKSKGVDIVFDNKASEGAIKYALMNFITEFSEKDKKDYFVDFLKPEKETEEKTFEALIERPIDDIDITSANVSIMLDSVDRDVTHYPCSLEDLNKEEIVLKHSNTKSVGVSKIFNKTLNCSIELDYLEQKIQCMIGLYVDKIDFIDNDYYIFGKVDSPSSELEELIELFKERQNNISRYIYHAKV